MWERRARAERAKSLRDLARRGAADPEAAECRATKPLVADCPSCSPHDDVVAAVRDHVEAVTAESVGGDTVVPTVDMRLQRRAWAEAKRAAAAVERRGRGRGVQTLVVVLPPEGGVRAWVSGRPGRARGSDRIRDGRLRLASTLKPLLLAPDVETGPRQGG